MQKKINVVFVRAVCVSLLQASVTEASCGHCPVPLVLENTPIYMRCSRWGMVEYLMPLPKMTLRYKMGKTL
jgi:hypothetical protein